jgi:aspartate/methionine/tyrosine aminotransferase
MFPPSPYLTWAQTHYGDLPFDLATSGTPPATMDDLAVGAPLADFGAEAALREAVAARYGVSPREVVPCLGASGGVFLAYATLLGPGDGVLVEEPTYEPLLACAAALGARVTRFSRGIEQRYALDPSLVARALAADASIRIVAVTQLHNPSGVAASTESLKEIAALLAPRGGHLFVDEVYGELVAPRFSVRTLAPNIVTTSSLTKCFGLGFLRAGWVLLPEALVPAAHDVLRHTTGHLPPVIWSLATAGLAKADALAERRLSLMAGKRERIDAFLEAHPDLAWAEPPHPRSLFGFVRYARPEGLRARLEQGRVDEGVLAVPGEFFGDANGFRLGFTLPESRLDEALVRLARVLR